MSRVSINLNDSVTFRLNSAGKAELAKEHAHKPQNPDGSYTMSLWEVMAIFGPSIFMGMPSGTYFEENVLEYETC